MENEFQLAKLPVSSRNQLWKQGVLFDQMKVSERRTESKNWNEVIPTIKKTSSVPHDQK